MKCKTYLYRTISNGCIYYINFGETIHPEINNIHLGVLFNIKCCKNMVFCLPLTSPKEKHFKTLKDFKMRNYHNLKYANLYYIKETDSIILMDQFRTISKNRVKNKFKEDGINNKNNLSNEELNKIKIAFNKYFKLIFN